MTEQKHATSAFTLRLFGPFIALVDDQPLERIHSRKEQWLLALLTLRGDRELERDWIAQTLWPESDQGRALLRETLSDLRHALGSEADRLLSPTPRTLRLDLSGADCDLLA